MHLSDIFSILSLNVLNMRCFMRSYYKIRYKSIEEGSKPEESLLPPPDEGVDTCAFLLQVSSEFCHQGRDKTHS